MLSVQKIYCKLQYCNVQKNEHYPINVMQYYSKLLYRAHTEHNKELTTGDML